MMPSNLDDFFFDVNYGMGSEGVFSLVDKLEGSVTPPPPEGYFLLLDNSNFLLLDGENLTLL